MWRGACLKNIVCLAMDIGGYIHLLIQRILQEMWKNITWIVECMVLLAEAMEMALRKLFIAM